MTTHSYGVSWEIHSPAKQLRAQEEGGKDFGKTTKTAIHFGGQIVVGNCYLGFTYSS